MLLKVVYCPEGLKLQGWKFSSDFQCNKTLIFTSISDQYVFVQKPIDTLQQTDSKKIALSSVHSNNSNLKNSKAHEETDYLFMTSLRSMNFS